MLMSSLFFFIAVVIVFVAYFVKGFTGFGPALILIPSLSHFFPPQQVIYLSTLLDVFAGIYLLISVYRLIDWKMVLPVLMLFFPGAYLGARLLSALDVLLLKRLLGMTMLFFIGLIWFNTLPRENALTFKLRQTVTLPVSFFAGIGGGLFGISGPLLVVYFKLALKKAAFRAQLIAIFAFGALWRLFLYHSLGQRLHLQWWQFGIFLLTMLGAIYTGSLLHLHINQKKFDRVVALVLLVPSFSLLFS